MLAGDDRFPGLADLLDEEKMRVLNKARLGFPIAGLFVGWLHEEFGGKAIAEVYGRYESDAAGFAGALGLSVEEIETRFAGYVRRQAAVGDMEAQFREATAKARHYGGLGDYEQAIPALERALELRPEHLFTRYGLAVARLKLEQLDAAEAELTKILEIHREESNDQMALLAWYQLGELYAIRGEADKAHEAYGQVLKLPDFRGMHERARDARDEIGQDD
ncbi:MAG: tetratricopeptide repeat protein [Acidobacteria bacterium]|nr:tetratricopeptide repeat protein [Acidobacteriota bacterium]NIM61637.1 tetratricopeptide repeat protein [Acidobacteriota bacterium]NIO58168.1 tetratricopeptide repeat protein [Acidobacteriota bacterium]NIQ29181.1 tetratricopeptide repeat protein [Acidobacteriota bacterium]NIQ83725.1 tetratricopeptide repeat protein [Acidobacteriota bacterium]